ncbi:MAG: restriction endonuclease subunit S [Thermoplasmatota archaeon]
MTASLLTLGDVIEPARPVRAGKSAYPILSMTMREGLVDQADKFKKRVASDDTAAYKVVRKNQLVVGFPIDEGVLAFQRQYESAIVSPAYDVWNLKGSAVDAEYLELYLRSPVALTFYRAKLRGTTARRRSLPDDLFLSLPVRVPPISEQRRVVGVLKSIDAIRRKRAQASRLLDDALHGIFLDMFGDPATNPKGWPIESIGGVSNRVTKGESPGWQGFAYQQDGALFVTSENVREGEIDLNSPKFIPLAFHEKLRRSQLQRGDILVNLVGASIGRSCVFPGFPKPANVNQAVGVVSIEPKKADPTYVAAVLASHSGQKALLGSRVESARANISLTDLREYPLMMPPLPAQRNFATVVATVGQLKARLTVAMEAAEAFARSSIAHLFTPGDA